MNWDDLRLFLQIAESGSLNQAAKKLKLTQPTLSRRLSSLEAEIGEALVKRNNEGVSLTRLGQKLVKSCQSMAAWAHEAESIAQGTPEKPEGKVILTAPPGVAFDFVAPLAAKIREKYPLIHLEVLSNVKIFNLSRGDSDMALRTHFTDEPGIVCLDHLTLPMAVFASKDYAKKLKQKPKLTDLNWIGWPDLSDRHTQTKQIKNQISSSSITFTSDDYNVQVAACVGGGGAMIMPKVKNRFLGMNNLVDLKIPLGKEANWDLFFVCHKRLVHIPKFEAVGRIVKEEFAKLRSQ